MALCIFSYRAIFMHVILFSVHDLTEHNHVLKFYKKKNNYPSEDELNGTATECHGRLKVNDFTIINWRSRHDCESTLSGKIWLPFWVVSMTFSG